MGAPAGFFLRAEAMHAYFAGIDDRPAQARSWGGQPLNTRSHGESFLEVLRLLGHWGIRRVDRYDDLELVAGWRSFLDSPGRYLRHLLGAS